MISFDCKVKFSRRISSPKFIGVVIVVSSSSVHASVIQLGWVDAELAPVAGSKDFGIGGLAKAFVKREI
jgi:hypothetical protein